MAGKRSSTTLLSLSPQPVEVLMSDRDRPAFPMTERNDDGSHHFDHPGLSAREYFAAQAMAGIFASGPTAASEDAIPHLMTTVATMSVQAADALLAALKEG